jgi:hypothetical protein
MTNDNSPPPPHVVPFHPSGSTFLISVEVLLWALYTVGFIMILVIVMMT